MNNKKGQIAVYVVWFFMAIVLVIIVAFFAPLGARINTEFYKAGEQIILSANSSISNISNTTIRNEIQGALSNAQLASQNNIEVNASIFQYSWIPILVLGAIVVFLFARRLVEVGGGFV